MTNPLDAERRSLNNASGRKAAPNLPIQRKPPISVDLEEVKRRSENK